MRRYVHRAIAIVLLCACGGTRTDVYVAGFVETGGRGPTATLWTNGKAVALTAEPQSSVANAVTISETGDVYVAGYFYVPFGAHWMIPKAAYWKNGALVSLSDGQFDSSADAIAVSGGHVYVAGYETISWPDMRTIAKLWKDGVATPLTDGSTQADGLSIAVSGADVYVAGYEVETTQVDPAHINVMGVAKYWKNGVAIKLADGRNDSAATSVALFGGDVYVGGWEGVPGPGLARVWKNGAAVALTDDAPAAQIHAVTFRGGDVLAVGGQFVGGGNVPKIWTNGVAASLVADRSGYAQAIVVAGTDVFVAGHDGDTAVYWKNGTAYPLSGPMSHAEATSIAVYQH